MYIKWFTVGQIGSICISLSVFYWCFHADDTIACVKLIWFFFLISFHLFIWMKIFFRKEVLPIWKFRQTVELRCCSSNGSIILLFTSISSPFSLVLSSRLYRSTLHCMCLCAFDSKLKNIVCMCKRGRKRKRDTKSKSVEYLICLFIYR